MNGTGLEMPITARAHTIVGGTVPGPGLLRLVLHWRHGVSPHESHVSLLVRWSSKLMHMALYSLMLGMPVTGLLASFGWS
jgi:cytochrome b561